MVLPREDGGSTGGHFMPSLEEPPANSLRDSEPALDFKGLGTIISFSASACGAVLGTDHPQIQGSYFM